MNKLIGKNIRYIRNLYGYSKQQLADLVGIGKCTLINVERGEVKMKEYELNQFSKALKVSVEDLCREWEPC